MAAALAAALAVAAACAHGSAARATPSLNPTHDEVKGGAYWRQLAAAARSEDEALSSIRRGLAADRRHLYAWHWLLKLVLRHVRASGGRWPDRILPAPASWAESDNGSFWHLRAAVLAEQLRLLPGAEAQAAALGEELALVWCGHWKQGGSESRWTYHRHLLELLAARKAVRELDGERESLRGFVAAFPEHAAVVRYALDALRPSAAGADREERVAAWLELVEALRECDPFRAGLYAELAAEISGGGSAEHTASDRAAGTGLEEAPEPPER